MGIEGLARQAALMSTPKKVEIIKNKNKIVYTNEVYESKQDMKFPKYYTSEICKNVIDLRQKADSIYMFDRRTKHQTLKISDSIPYFSIRYF